MIAKTPLLFVLSLTASLLASGCDSGSKKEETKDDAKQEKTAAKDETKGDDKKADRERPRKYRRGQRAPAGMTLEQIKEFAQDVDDPTGGEFTLAQALAGDADLADESKGTLTATIETSMGVLEDCELYEKQTPRTVANFVGLARGKRASYDAKKDEWVTIPYYDGVVFHRVKADFMVQTGDRAGSGRGNPGFVIPDEFVDGLKHDAPGVLSMANQEKPNTGSTQFFITVVPTPHLDGKHTVFGKCPDAKVAKEISKVKVDPRVGDRPYENVTIERITISRKPSTKKNKGKK